MDQQLQRAKALRRNLTDAEQKLWYHLRGHRFAGIKFKRQKPIGPYIVDFIATERMLIIELDGSQHLANTYDTKRDAWLKAQGFSVLRFWNNQVLTETEAVLEEVRLKLAEIDQKPSP